MWIIPRVSGVSTSSTVWRMRRRPIPSTVSAWVRLNPIGLRTRVILTVLPDFAFDFAFAIGPSPPTP